MKASVFRSCLLSLVAFLCIACQAETTRAVVVDRSPTDSPIPSDNGFKVVRGQVLDAVGVETILIQGPAWAYEGDSLVVTGPYVYTTRLSNQYPFYIWKEGRYANLPKSERDAIRSKYRKYKIGGYNSLQNDISLWPGSYSMACSWA